MMNFIDSYKKLEKLCNEMYGDKHGVSLYIDEMINTPVGSRYVKSRNEDLKQLKHYRWARNQIVHEPGCTETNMCNRDDIQWINNFYTRMMSTSDPLSLYRKTIRSNRKTHSSSGGKSASRQCDDSQQKGKHSRFSQESHRCGVFVWGTIIAVIVIFLFFKVIL